MADQFEPGGLYGCLEFTTAGNATVDFYCRGFKLNPERQECARIKMTANQPCERCKGGGLIASLVWSEVFQCQNQAFLSFKRVKNMMTQEELDVFVNELLDGDENDNS